MKHNRQSYPKPFTHSKKDKLLLKLCEHLEVMSRSEIEGVMADIQKIKERRSVC